MEALNKTYCCNTRLRDDLWRKYGYPKVDKISYSSGPALEKHGNKEEKMGDTNC